MVPALSSKVHPVPSFTIGMTSAKYVAVPDTPNLEINLIKKTS